MRILLRNQDGQELRVSGMGAREIDALRLIFKARGITMTVEGDDLDRAVASAVSRITQSNRPASAEIIEKVAAR